VISNPFWISYSIVKHAAQEYECVQDCTHHHYENEIVVSHDFSLLFPAQGYDAQGNLAHHFAPCPGVLRILHSLVRKGNDAVHPLQIGRVAYFAVIIQPDSVFNQAILADFEMASALDFSLGLGFESEIGLHFNLR
jgi:hypothetical protein